MAIRFHKMRQAQHRGRSITTTGVVLFIGSVVVLALMRSERAFLAGSDRRSKAMQAKAAEALHLSHATIPVAPRPALKVAEKPRELEQRPAAPVQAVAPKAPEKQSAEPPEPEVMVKKEEPKREEAAVPPKQEAKPEPPKPPVQAEAPKQEPPKDTAVHVEPLKEVQVRIRRTAELPPHLQRSTKFDDGHWLLDRQLTSPRRNHACLIDPAVPEQNLPERLLLVGGRFSENVEVMDLDSTDKGVIVLDNNINLLPNHVQLVEVKEGEYWVPCGLVNHGVNDEKSMENVGIIKRSVKTPAGDGKPPVFEWKLEQGPKLDVPRGACAAVPIKLDGGDNLPNVCVIGGSSGGHDSADFRPNISCWSSVHNNWQYLTPLPYGIDHGNAIVVPADVCGEHESPRLIVMNYRDRPYGKPLTAILSLELQKTDEKGGLKQAEGAKWEVIYDKHREWATDAAAMEIYGKYLFKFGGKRNFNRQEIHAFDMCKRRWVPHIHQLYVPRYAIQSCQSPANFAYVCGGESCCIFDEVYLNRANNPKRWGRGGNYMDCEILDLKWLTDVADNKALTLTEADA